MKKEILQDIPQSMESIDYFSDFQQESTLNINDAMLCDSLTSFKKSIVSPEWEDIRAEAAGQLSSLLNSKFQGPYQEWNSVAKEARLFVDIKVETKILAIPSEPHAIELVNDIGYDIVHIIIERYFTKRCGIKGMPFKNFLIYKNGKIPCDYTLKAEKDFIRLNGAIIYC
ncbi:hypothetical protein [Chromobacterium violaceum]|uniref:hypothetical protein n=1 Tax=Chromobacterium violaceum TaxID=536 RepID=UPI001CE1CD1F|nr:hypothetical protein [Chromobacterium violaceum]